MSTSSRLSHSELLQLKRWNTPTIYNGWEQITRHDPAHDGVNLEPTTDFMPHMGPMVGYAVTIVVQPGNPEHPRNNPNAWMEYRKYVLDQPGPKIVVMQDLDKPACYGACWGEVNANAHRASGCVGVIVDGAVRDLDEMNNAGFKALARRLAVGHGFACPVRWNCEVEVFGRKIQPGQLIHADKHGFLAVPQEDETKLLDAARFMDTNECKTLIAAGRNTAGLTAEQLLKQMGEAGRAFDQATREKFGRSGEWK